MTITLEDGEVTRQLQAASRATGEPLLFKGDDFTWTDLTRA